MDDPILQVQDIRAEFATPDGIVRAVNDVSFSLGRGRTLVLTGESGSGKSTIALAIMGLLPSPAGRITAGHVLLEGRDLLALQPDEMRLLRGKEIAIVFQDPSSSLNPVLSVGQQVEEIITNHLAVSKREARRQAIDVLRRIGLPDPADVVKRYPFQLSGGMAQRVMIAIATALQPSVLILDEPTSALDVTVQAAILDDLQKLQREQETSILLITHDLGVVAQMADDVAVMYAGHIAEYGTAQEVFARPRHPYTWSLLQSRPRWDKDREELGRLLAIRGNPPSLIDLPDECPFLPRCPKATSICRIEPAPRLTPVEGDGHLTACYNPMYLDDDQA
ncbi:MAG TPA: ABC transporter ATP-binding protein [Dehalococcoidia bacterium]|nr:ABC transporter ATP-binding protein [Dehalococcoidia bacterium]